MMKHRIVENVGEIVMFVMFGIGLKMILKLYDKKGKRWNDEDGILEEKKEKKKKQKEKKVKLERKINDE